VSFQPLRVFYLAQIFGTDSVKEVLEELLLPNDLETLVLGDIRLFYGLMHLEVLEKNVNNFIGLHVLDALLSNLAQRCLVFMTETTEVHDCIQTSRQSSPWLIFGREGLQLVHVRCADSFRNLIKLFAVFLLHIVSFRVVTCLVVRSILSAFVETRKSCEHFQRIVDFRVQAGLFTRTIVNDLVGMMHCELA
jgi:hypothetical protein